MVFYLKNLEISANLIEVIPMEIEEQQRKKTFPNLMYEITENKQTIEVHSIRSDNDVAEKSAQAKKNFSNYNPDIIDFIRRCDSKQQAEEIINFMEERSEITQSYAEKLKRQLRKRGVRSFGSKKKEGYYFGGSTQ